MTTAKMPQREHLKQLIINHTRRLHELEEKRALLGIHADPSINIEIEDIKSELETLEETLVNLKDPNQINSSANNLSPRQIALDWSKNRRDSLYGIDLNSQVLLAIDLEGADLRVANLSKANLRRSNLRKTDLSLANLEKAILAGTTLVDARLVEANLREADLSMAVISRADLTMADLYKANLYKANLTKTNLNAANLNEADLSKAELGEATVVEGNLTSANLFGSKLRRATLLKTNFSGANLSEADLTEAQLVEAVLNKTNLTGSNLNGTNFQEAELIKANLYQANLSGTNLRKAHLTGVDLRKANLHKANLLEADLSEADLCGADLSNAYLTGDDLLRDYLSGATIPISNSSFEDLKNRFGLQGSGTHRPNLYRIKYDNATKWPQSFDPPINIGGLLEEALELEPRLKSMIEKAKNQKNEPGYNRVITYSNLKREAGELVGWGAQNRALQTQEHFIAVIETIMSLLPSDDEDLSQ